MDIEQRHNISPNHPKHQCTPIPHNKTNIAQWIEEIANIGKQAKNEPHIFTSKQTAINYTKAIKQYKTLLDKTPKIIHEKNSFINTPLDCAKGNNNDILTNPVMIANEI